jgi:saposin
MEALFYLNENETQTEIISTLHQACSKFPSFNLDVFFYLIYFLYFYICACFTRSHSCFITTPGFSSDSVQDWSIIMPLFSSPKFLL